MSKPLQSKQVSYVNVYNTFAVFLFSALALIVPSGYSYGPLLLFFASFLLIVRRPSFNLESHDWWFIAAISTYFCTSIFLNLYQNLPFSSYDKPLRYLIAIPVYLFLVAFPSHRNGLFLGIIFGSLGAGVFAFYQQHFLYDQLVWPGRSNGFLNPIQFGNISFLIAVLSIVFAIFFPFSNKEKYIYVLLLVSGVAGFLASFLSLSRGGWLALPVLFLLMYKLLENKQKKIFRLISAITLFLLIGLIAVLPKENAFKNRLFETNVEVLSIAETGSVSERTSMGSRLKMWSNGINAWIERPFLGWGSLPAIKKQFPEQWAELNKLDDFNHLHNEYIDALAKNGIVGFTSFIFLLIAPLYYFVGIIRKKSTEAIPFAAAGIALIVCIMIFGLTQCFLLHHSGTMVFLFYLVIIKAFCRAAVVNKD